MNTKPIDDYQILGEPIQAKEYLGELRDNQSAREYTFLGTCME